MALAQDCALVRWEVDKSLSVVNVRSIIEGKAEAGEKVRATYLRKIYQATILELGNYYRVYLVGWLWLLWSYFSVVVKWVGRYCVVISGYCGYSYSGYCGYSYTASI